MSPGPSQLPTGKPRPREAGEGRGQGTQRSGAALGGRSQSKDLKLGLRFDLRWGSGFRKALRAAVTGQFQASKRGILGTQSCVILCLPGAELRCLLSSPSGQSGARGKPPSQGLLGSCIGSAGSPRKGAPKTHGSLSHPRRPGVRATGWAFPPPHPRSLASQSLPSPGRMPPLHRQQCHSLGFLSPTTLFCGFTQQLAETQIRSGHPEALWLPTACGIKSPFPWHSRPSVSTNVWNALKRGE